MILGNEKLCISNTHFTLEYAVILHDFQFDIYSRFARQKMFISLNIYLPVIISYQNLASFAIPFGK